MRKKTALIAAIGALIIFGTIAAALFSSGGDTKSVQRIAAPTSLYGEADISSAFDAVEATFASDFTGCTLKELRYNGEIEKTFLDDELDRNQAGAEDRIIVLSTFTTNWRSTNEGFSPNETYEDWQWILTRPTQNAAWSVEGWGYC